MQLLHHYSTETCKAILADRQDAGKATELLMKAALSEPFLMQEVLAMASLHLSILNPAQREFYHHQASGFQTRALSLFNSSHLEVNADNCVAIVVFSSHLAMHSLCDVVNAPGDDFSDFLDRFIRSSDLHRGVRALASHSWDFLQQSEMRDFLKAGQEVHATTDLVGEECNNLRALLNSADIGQASMKACQAAIDHLQRSFDMDGKSVGNRFTTWMVIVPAEYMDLLMKRSPEALVILAYYAVILHRHRGDWFIGGGGKHLINAISRHLGSYWDSWLAWPVSVIHETAVVQNSSNVQTGTN